ncbi:MAG TPA: 30S ribosomal protein S5 [Clostridiales bacterium]|nr:MAG: 30S ribosomal protein S5 [Clostridiales bacterium GWD2_32_19]HCC07396.1 30S ribosomal protein S5 [Clostridiales bacterium]
MSTKIDTSKMDLKEKVVSVKRVTKVVKGGRNFRFAVVVVVGDYNGCVGVGTGKSIEIPDAIKKAIEDAKKHMIYVPRNEDGSIYHQNIGKAVSSEVLIKPAPQGTGVIAGGTARAVLELAGIKNIRSKSLGSNNKRNVVSATIEALKTLKKPEDVARARGKKLSEIIG